MKIFSAVGKYLKHAMHSVDNSLVKKNVLNALPFWVAAFITGAAAVLYAQLYAYAEAVYFWTLDWADWSVFILTPACFVLGWLIVIRHDPYAKGSGIPQVTAAIELSNPRQHLLVRKLLSLRIVVVKLISSLVIILGGGVIGREGPTIQIAASIFKMVNGWLPDWYPKVSKQNMIITGAAAGLASAFNTPLGGIVFAVEELTKTHFNFFKSALLTGVIISGLTALTFLGPYLYIGFPQLDGISIWIMVVIIPVAMLCGWTGAIMCRLMLYIMKQRKRLDKYWKQILFCIVAGSLVATMAYISHGEAAGSGKHLMVRLLFMSDKHLEWYVPILRVLGQAFSFTNGAAGGVFAPALAAGAGIGAVIANFLHLLPSETNLIVLCGMVGMLTGVTRSPFTSCILVIEMTTSHTIIFYIMVAALFASLIAGLVAKHGFYDVLKEQILDELKQPRVKAFGEVENLSGVAKD